jgi:hypothetical protein
LAPGDGVEKMGSTAPKIWTPQRFAWEPAIGRATHGRYRLPHDPGVMVRELPLENPPGAPCLEPSFWRAFLWRTCAID